MIRIFVFVQKQYFNKNKCNSYKNTARENTFYILKVNINTMLYLLFTSAQFGKLVIDTFCQTADRWLFCSILSDNIACCLYMYIYVHHIQITIRVIRTNLVFNFILYIIIVDVCTGMISKCLHYRKSRHTLNFVFHHNIYTRIIMTVILEFL